MSRTDRTRRRSTLALGILLVVTVGKLAIACTWGRSDDPVTSTTATTNRDQGVEEHSRDVMPFDLERATHTFEPRPDGLIETVVTNPPDPAEIEAIRGHLRHEEVRFAAGDFSDPAHIHGEDMPGLAELRAGYQRLTVTYTDVPAGGRLTYTTADPALVDALHRWGQAQTSDHGHGPGHTGAH